MQQYHNPFAGLSVVYPSDQASYYQKYCQTGGRQSVDTTPFGRMVDLWFLGLSLSARNGLPPVDLSGKKTSNMTPGSIFDGRDSWRVQVLMLIAIAMTDDVSVLENPNRMMAIANGMAAAGVPSVVDVLEEAGEPPIWKLTEALRQMLTP